MWRFPILAAVYPYPWGFSSREFIKAPIFWLPGTADYWLEMRKQFLKELAHGDEIPPIPREAILRDSLVCICCGSLTMQEVSCGVCHTVISCCETCDFIFTDKETAVKVCSEECKTIHHVAPV